jgi:hypothetical protein
MALLERGDLFAIGAAKVKLARRRMVKDFMVNGRICGCVEDRLTQWMEKRGLKRMVVSEGIEEAESEISALR